MIKKVQCVSRATLEWSPSEERVVCIPPYETNGTGHNWAGIEERSPGFWSRWPTGWISDGISTYVPLSSGELWAAVLCEAAWIPPQDDDLLHEVSEKQL